MNVDQFLWTPRRSAWRWPLALAAAVACIAHIPVIGPHLDEAPYMGEEFIVLTLACGLLSIAVLICDSVAAYLLAAATCGLAILGYVLTRLMTFPQLADDVGNWFEPLGVASVLSEAMVVFVATAALVPRRAFGRRVALGRLGTTSA